ncbi:Uncharacterised protein [Mycoplasmopsis maculosa]|uniref:Transposase n=1 Tax=Mycoplasmopsis maculosa TaxID=114885 RepID=A0A449B483_9BACT|nr:hypothetical protein [Mycoplasmopsis maculosa]VEU75375.1 Uncharacterised protein [Mycoplasmopsis maculosa]
MTNYILEILKKNIEKKDQIFKHSKERINLGLKIHSYITRKIKLKEGILEVILTKYKYYDKNGKLKTCIFNKDELLEKNYKKRVDISLLEEAKNWYLTGTNLGVISNRFNISKTLISSHTKSAININDNQKDKLVKYSNFETVNKAIYLSVDDTYFHSKKDKYLVDKKRARMLNFFMLDSNKKPVFKNHIFLISNTKKILKIDDIIKQIEMVIKECYSEDFKLIILGDGATWISKLAKKLKAKYILCRFHLWQKIKVIFNNSSTLKEDLKYLNKVVGFNFRSVFFNLLMAKKYDDLTQLIYFNFENIELCLGKNRAKLLFSLCRYIHNNYDGLIEVSENNELFKNNNAEAFVSHLIKKAIKKSWCLYSLEVCILKIKANFEGAKWGLKIVLF